MGDKYNLIGIFYFLKIKRIGAASFILSISIIKLDLISGSVFPFNLPSFLLVIPMVHFLLTFTVIEGVTT